MLVAFGAIALAILRFGQVPAGEQTAIFALMLIPAGAFIAGLLVFGVGQVINLVGRTAHHAGVIADCVLMMDERGADAAKTLGTINAHARRTADALGGAVVTHGGTP